MNMQKLTIPMQTFPNVGGSTSRKNLLVQNRNTECSGRKNGFNAELKFIVPLFRVLSFKTATELKFTVVTRKTISQDLLDVPR